MSVDVDVEDPQWTSALPNAHAVIERAAFATLSARAEGGVAVLLTSDAEVAALNKRFRGKDGPTNVLSFPAATNPEGHLGDLALALGVCAAEGRNQHKTLEAHVSHLIVHGVLHLLGYDHDNDADAETMEALERDILAALGVPDPYAANDHVDAAR